LPDAPVRESMKGLKEKLSNLGAVVFAVVGAAPT
jgi:hypothetical protein